MCDTVEFDCHPRAAAVTLGEQALSALPYLGFDHRLLVASSAPIHPTSASPCPTSPHPPHPRRGHASQAPPS